MGIFSIFRRQKTTKEPESDENLRYKQARVTRLSNDLRRKSLEMRERKLERLHQIMEERAIEDEILDLEEQLQEEDGDLEKDGLGSPDQLFTQLITKAFSKPMINNPSMAINNAALPFVEYAPQKVNLTDEQIREFKNKVSPQHIAHFKRLSDEDAAALIQQYQPTLDEDTISRATIILKE